MSKYWNKMELFRKKNNNNNLFISEKSPAFFTIKKYNLETSSRKILNIREIDDFYYLNYNIDNGTSFTKINSEKYFNVDAEILTIRVENNLIGSIVSLLIPIKIITELNVSPQTLSDRFSFFGTDETLIFGCTSFLVLDKKYRRKGYGMAMIQESLQILYKNGGLGAYFINNVPRGDNSIKLNIWYFSLNSDKSINDKYIFEIIKNPELTIEKVKNIEQSFDFYISQVKNRKFAFVPSMAYWIKWIENFPTYNVIKNEKIIGIFCFNNCNIRYPIKKMELSNGYLLFCYGEQPETLQSSIEIAKGLFDVLNIHETGDLSASLIDSVSAKKYDKYRYINFFNTQIQLKASEFHAPIF